tara:strand:+ start:254 stop:454 length:201 start_codon:yes stop_codon:yes gene_type:complete
MRHDWIFEVLTDLRTYAQQNDLQALAAEVESALATARVEIGMEVVANKVRLDEDEQDGVPPGGRPH